MLKSEGVFVHHTTGETPAEHARCPVLWEQHRQYHIKTRGYKDIGYCLAPHIRVLTADLRWILVGDLIPGDTLHAFTEPSRAHWSHATVEQTGLAKLPAYRVILEDGSEFVASSEHRWLVFIKKHYVWRTTEQLVNPSRQMHVASGKTYAIKLLEPWREDRSREAGYLAGLWDGDGWLMNHQGVREWQLTCALAQNEGLVLDRVEKLLVGRGFDYALHQTNKSKLRQLNIQGGRRGTLRFLGEIRPHRLLQKWQEAEGLMGRLKNSEPVAVAHAEFLGPQEVVTLQTSTGTLIAEGFGHHNSFGFCPHGSRLQGRGWDVVGAHTKDWNSRSHGFAFLGDGNQVTTAALAALRALITEHDQRYGRGFIRGHRDVAQTACPGDKLYAALPSIRREEEDMNTEQDRKLEEIHQAMRLTVQPFVDEIKNGEWIVKPLVAEMQQLAPTIGEDAIVSAVKRALIEGTS